MSKKQSGREVTRRTFMKTSAAGLALGAFAGPRIAEAKKTMKTIKIAITQ